MSSDPSLLAILFISTTSSKGSHLVFRWPARPKAVTRLARPKPIVRQLDYAWRASHPSSDLGGEPESRLYNVSRKGSYNALMLHEADEDGINAQSTPAVPQDAERNDSSSAYEWNMRDWSNQFGHYLDPKLSGRLARGASARKNPTAPYPTDPNERGDPDFDWVLGYRTKLLAESVFRFDRNLCNQRFELILEDLLFLGHPVCIGDDGTWQWEQLYADPKTKTDSNDPNVDENTEVNNVGKSQSKDPKNEASLKYFHLVLVLDRPDAALGGSVNLTRFIDVYYEQIAVKMTAALHYEQSRTGYVEKETDLLVDLMDAETYDEFEKTALERSSLARAIRDIFVAVQNQRLAHVNVGAFELDLQMPWYHSELLTGEDDPEGAGDYSYENERDERWDPGFGKGWRVKRLLPWNTLLFIDGWETEADIEPESEEMLKFREVLTPDTSFADAAALLDWDLETEVMRMARYMIYLKKAKVSDVVHPKLLNIYFPPARSDATLNDLCKRFKATFPPTTPALETILAAISSSPQAFFNFVPSDDHYELYHQILIWLLKNDALIMLHVRFRLVATPEIKQQVYNEAQARFKGSGEERGRKRKPSGLGGRERRDSDARLLENGKKEDDTVRQSSPTRDQLQPIEDRDEDGPEFDIPEDFEESFIMDPGKATRLEQLWIDAIARKRPDLEERFLRVCEYFDGRTTFDEIQYRSQMKRSQFRQIASEYDDWLLALLHP